MDKQNLRRKEDGVWNSHEGFSKNYCVSSWRVTLEYLEYRGIQADIIEVKAMQHRCTIEVVGPRVIMEGEQVGTVAL